MLFARFLCAWNRSAKGRYGYGQSSARASTQAGGPAGSHQGTAGTGSTGAQYTESA